MDEEQRRALGECLPVPIGQLAEPLVVRDPDRMRMLVSVPCSDREPGTAGKDVGDRKRDDLDDLGQARDRTASRCRRRPRSHRRNRSGDVVGAPTAASAGPACRAVLRAVVPGPNAVLVGREHDLLLARQRSRHGQGHRRRSGFLATAGAGRGGASVAGVLDRDDSARRHAAGTLGVSQRTTTGPSTSDAWRSGSFDDVDVATQPRGAKDNVAQLDRSLSIQFFSGHEVLRSKPAA